MEFIAQFKSSIIGTSNTLISDVFLYKGRIYMFIKKSNGNFELSIIENNEYFKVSRKFENFIEQKDIDSDSNLLHLWRAKKVITPELMPIRYYEDIIQLKEYCDIIEYNKISRIKNIFNKINKELNESI